MYLLLNKFEFFNKALASIGTLHSYLISCFYFDYIYIFKQNWTATNSLAYASHTSLLLVRLFHCEVDRLAVLYVV